MSLKTHQGCGPVLSYLLAVLGCILFSLTGCGSGTQGSASAVTGTPTPTPAPPTTGANGGPTIIAPANGANVTSPVTFNADAGSLTNVDHMKLLLAGTGDVFDGEYGQGSSAGKWIYLPDGQQQLTVQAFDIKNNLVGSANVTVNVTGQTSPDPLSALQAIPAWQWCSATLFNKPCASGLGQAVSKQVNNQASPSLSGSSTLYTLSGKQAYSNALWWISLGGGTLVSSFDYDLDFYIDDATAPEALEFDVNQSIGGTRYTWGTECSYKNTKKWDVWNPQAEVWVPSSAPCPQVTSKQWHHLKWQFERINNQVHYISVSVDDNTYPVNMYLNPQTKWFGSDFDIAFQMDGDYKQTPYNVWLDNVTLTSTY